MVHLIKLVINWHFIKISQKSRNKYVLKKFGDVVVSRRTPHVTIKQTSVNFLFFKNKFFFQLLCGKSSRKLEVVHTNKTSRITLFLTELQYSTWYRTI